MRVRSRFVRCMFWLAITVLMVAQVRAEPSAPSSMIITVAAHFVSSVPSDATVGQVKKLLPSTTETSRPKYSATELLFGSMVNFHGKLNGFAAFLPRGYRVRHGHLCPPHDLRPQPSDVLDEIYIMLSKHTDLDKSHGRQIIESLSHVLGRPSKMAFQPVLPGFDSSGDGCAWSASWKRSGKKIEFLQYGGGDLTEPILTLSYDYSANE